MGTPLALVGHAPLDVVTLWLGQKEIGWRRKRAS